MFVVCFLLIATANGHNNTQHFGQFILRTKLLFSQYYSTFTWAVFNLFRFDYPENFRLSTLITMLVFLAISINQSLRIFQSATSESFRVTYFSNLLFTKIILLIYSSCDYHRNRGFDLLNSCFSALSARHWLVIDTHCLCTPTQLKKSRLHCVS